MGINKYKVTKIIKEKQGTGTNNNYRLVKAIYNGLFEKEVWFVLEFKTKKNNYWRKIKMAKKLESLEKEYESK